MLILSVILAMISSYTLVPLLMPTVGRTRIQNYAGRQLPTGLGLAFIFASIVVWLLFPELVAGERNLPIVVLLGFSLLGLIDDLAGDSRQRGFQGHLNAVLNGQLTTGALKAVGGAVFAFLVSRAVTESFFPAAVQALLMVLMANLINLFDLRPGRAGKLFVGISLITAIVIPGAGWLLVLTGAVIGYLPWDLREKAIMGDTGANPLGGVLGFALASSAPVWVQLVVLVMIATLNLAAERVSFSRVIARNRVLHWLDKLGRNGGE